MSPLVSVSCARHWLWFKYHPDHTVISIQAENLKLLFAVNGVSLWAGQIGVGD